MPFRNAPCPRRALTVSPSVGAAITPISGVSPSRQAIEMQNRVAPRA